MSEMTYQYCFLYLTIRCSILLQVLDPPLLSYAEICAPSCRLIIMARSRIASGLSILLSSRRLISLTILSDTVSAVSLSIGTSHSRSMTIGIRWHPKGRAYSLQSVG